MAQGVSHRIFRPNHWVPSTTTTQPGRLETPAPPRSEQRACVGADSVWSSRKAAAATRGFPAANCQPRRPWGRQRLPSHVRLPAPPPGGRPGPGARGRPSGQDKVTGKRRQPARNKAPVPECERTPLRGQRPAPRSRARLRRADSAETRKAAPSRRKPGERAAAGWQPRTREGKAEAAYLRESWRSSPFCPLEHTGGTGAPKDFRSPPPPPRTNRGAAL